VPPIRQSLHMLPEPGTEIFETQRPRLLRLAHRMLITHPDAEDVVQEAGFAGSRAIRTE
jgi:RNA polymerase sigma-70 factor, ECF subfamily